MNQDPASSDRAIPLAVVGMSALFPGSAQKQAFWRNIVDGRDFITEVPAGHWLVEDYYDPDPSAPGKVYVRRGAFLPAVPFSPMEFGLPPANLPATDSVQLLALLGTKQLLAETRSLREGRVDRGRVSVVLGVAAGTELIGQMAAKIQRPHWAEALRREGLPEATVEAVCQRIFDSYPEWNESTFPGLLANVTAGRVANRFNLGGTNCVVDAACASSLGALALAADELRLGKTDLVVTGGADALNDIFMYMCFSRTPAMSFSGDCRPYSDAADGTMLGEGVGLFALRRLADAERDGDEIYAVIAGVGSSSDGSSKSIYAPRSEGQAEALRRAWSEAGCAPAEIGLIEGHGTATKAGDAAEVEGLKQAFGNAQGRTRPWCALGSVKSQIGHTKSAAGAAGLFKAVMALHHKVLPPTTKVDRPNPQLGLEGSPLYLNTAARPWVEAPGRKRRAGVSAFGFGGSNFHVLVEEYAGPRPAPRVSRARVHLLVLGAESVAALAAALRAALEEAGRTPLAAVARASQFAFDARALHRLVLVVRDPAHFGEQARAVLGRLESGRAAELTLPSAGLYSSAPPAGRELAFLFPGQGSQYVGMGADLAMEFEEARAVWDRAEEEVGNGLAGVVFPPPGFSADSAEFREKELTRTDRAQPAIGLTSLAMLAVLRRAGVAPDFAAGHSYGELTALHAGGVIATAAEFLRLSRARGRLMAEASAEAPGSMTAVLDASDAAELAQAHGLVVANRNSPRQTVVAGPEPAIARFESRLATGAGRRFQRLNVAAAFHTGAVAAAAEHFGAELASWTPGPAAIPVFANSTAQPYPGEPGNIRALLASQLARPVLFQAQIEAMHAAGARIFVEVGPGSALTTLTGQILADRPHRAIALDVRKQNGLEAFWTGIGQLAACGVPVDFAGLWKGFEAEMDDPTVRPLPKGAVAINGTNVGKPYPPAEGAAGRAAPVSERDCQAKPAPSINGPARGMDAPSSPPPSDLPQRLALIEQMHRNLFEATRHFQETLAQSHAAFLQASDTLLRQLTGAPGQAPAPATPTIAPPPPAPAPISAAPAVTLLRPPAIGTYSTNGHSIPAAPPPATASPAARPAPAPLASAPARDFRSIVLGAVAETTGYPEDMIELDMELESGLGIDSIKKVEIFSALQAKIPEFAGVDASQVSKLGTLREILDFTVGLAGGEKKN